MLELVAISDDLCFLAKGVGFIRANALTLRAAFGVAFISFRPNQWFIHFTPVHKQKTFLWSEIKAISLTRPKFPARERNLIPCLELTLAHGIYRIELKMLTDTERRNLLDCIENYKTITYNEKKYESNYMTWTMTTMILLFIFGNVMLLVGS